MCICASPSVRFLSSPCTFRLYRITDSTVIWETLSFFDLLAGYSSASVLNLEGRLVPVQLVAIDDKSNYE